MSFRAYNLPDAERVLKMAGVNRDDWTITDLTQPSQPGEDSTIDAAMRGDGGEG